MAARALRTGSRLRPCGGAFADADARDAAASGSKSGGSALDPEILGLDPTGEILEAPGKRARLAVDSPTMWTQRDLEASSTPAPAAAMATPSTTSCSSGGTADAHSGHASPAGGTAQELAGDGSTPTATALKSLGLKVVLAAGGVPTASSELKIAQKLSNMLLVRAADAGALMISTHGTQLKQMAALKRAMKEKLIVYIVADSMGADLPTPEDAERRGKRVHERLKSVSAAAEAVTSGDNYNLQHRNDLLEQGDRRWSATFERLWAAGLVGDERAPEPDQGGA